MLMLTFLLNQMDMTRFIQVYVVQGFVFVFFMFLVSRILKYNKKRLNIVFSRFYICVSIGILLNFIYAPLQIEGLETTVLILNFLTNFFITYGPIFLVVFLAILLKSEKIVTKKVELLIELAYGIALGAMIFFLPYGGVTIDPSTNWKPVYNLPFFLYLIAVITIFTTIPTFYAAKKVYDQFSDKELKTRWKYFAIGIIFLFTFSYGTLTSNFLNIDEFRSLWSIIGGLLVVFSAYLIYYGVGRQLQKS